MLHNERLFRLLIILGIVCTLVYLGKFLWEIGQSLADLLLLLAMAWLLAYILSPIAHWLNRGPIPRAAIEWVRHRWGDRPAGWLSAVRIPYGLAAVLLYLLTIMSIVLITVLIVPGIVNQLAELAEQLPDYVQQAPEWWENMLDKIIERFDVDRDALAKVDPMEGLVEKVTSSLPDILLDAVPVVQGIANGIANTLLVLILSLYFMLDGKRLAEQFYRLVPSRYQDEVGFIFAAIDRAFGGFLRGQVLMALIQGIFTGIVMRLFGLEFTMITAILSGLVMFIPELGAPVAMVAPAVVSALLGSGATIPLLIIMFLFQQILLRFIIPKIMSKAIGMPPLLILISVLLGAKVMGLWGFFFGIPVAGALYTITIVTLERVKQTVDAQDRQQAQQSRQELV